MNLDGLLQVELPVTVVLAEKPITLGETLSLREGSVIVFEKRPSELLDIYVQDRRIGRGKAIKVAERFGIHIREIAARDQLLAGLS